MDELNNTDSAQNTTPLHIVKKPRFSKKSLIIFGAGFLIAVSAFTYYVVSKDDSADQPSKVDIPVEIKKYQDNALNINYPSNWTAGKPTPTIETKNQIYKFDSGPDSTIKIAGLENIKDVVLSASVVIKDKVSENPLICTGCEVIDASDVTVNDKKYKLVIVDTNQNKQPDYVGITEASVKPGDKNFNYNLNISDTKQITVRATLLVKSAKDGIYSLVYEAKDANSLKQSKSYKALSQMLNTLVIK